MKAGLLTLSTDLKALDWNAQTKFIESIKGQKTAYLGHAYLYMNYPESTTDFLRKTAMYSDTTIINDPILSEIMSWERRGSGDVSAFNLVAQYAVRLLTMEDLFRSDLDPPICCLAPCSILSLGSEVYSPTDRLIEEYIVPTYAGRIFNKIFSSSDDVVSFLETMKNYDDFISAVNKSGVPFSNPDGSPVTLSDFSRVKEYYEDKYETDLEFSRALFLLLRGRYSMPAYDLAINGRIATNFATDFKGVWESFVWLLNNDNNQIANKAKANPLSKDTLVLNSLQKDEFKWIGNVPLNKIVEMRERGELQDMRELLSRSINEITTASDEEFVEVRQQVEYNLEQAFKKHRNEVQELSESYTIKYKIHLVSVAVTGTLGLVSALYPPIAQSIGLLSSSIAESVSAIELVKNFLEERRSLNILQRKPVGMLFEARKMKT